eukprot:COSAG06_NODE_15496_length_1066_cov_76.960703_1_plen_211_part_10
MKRGADGGAPLPLLLAAALLLLLLPPSQSKGSFSWFGGRRAASSSRSTGYYRAPSGLYVESQDGQLREIGAWRRVWCWITLDFDCPTARPFLVEAVDASLPWADGMSSVELTLVDRTPERPASIVGSSVTDSKNLPRDQVFLAPKWYQRLAVGWPDVTAKTAMKDKMLFVEVYQPEIRGWFWSHKPKTTHGVACLRVKDLPDDYASRITLR